MNEFCNLNLRFDSDAIRNAMEYAADCHIGTNQKYDNHSYTIHLKMVYDFGCKFAHLLHNDVKKRCGYEVAEIVYALTNEKGRTREERANDKYYNGIRALETATYVKLCDRLANFSYSVAHNQRMAEIYRNELPHFKQMLFNERFKPMFDLLETF